MKSKYFCSLLICLALLISASSCEQTDSPVLTFEDTDTIEVALCSGSACCSQLRVAEGAIASPTSCEGNINALHAINMDEFGLDMISDCNEKRTIEYSLLSDCEAVGESYDCEIVCDMIHGLPIKIIKVMD